MRCNGEPGEAGCPSCGHAGEIEIPHCPGREVDAATRRLVQLCRFAGDGRMPVDGGVLDQTQAFLDVLEFYEADRAELKAKRNPLGLGDE